MRVTGASDVKAGISHYRPHGEWTLVDAVDLIRLAITDCREQLIDRLLIVATGLTGISVPSLVDRFLMAEEWANAAEGMVRVALVVHPEFIHPEKFGVKVALSFGLSLDVFSDEERALSWLTGCGPAAKRTYG
jgi:hypothetical protein